MCSLQTVSYAACRSIALQQAMRLDPAGKLNYADDCSRALIIADEYYRIGDDRYAKLTAIRAPQSQRLDDQPSKRYPCSCFVPRASCFSCAPKTSGFAA